MIRSSLIYLATFCALAGPALALDLPANAKRTLQNDSKLDSYIAPFGPFVDGSMQTQLIEGEVRRSAWRIASPGITTLQILAPLREQLQATGFNIVLDCDQVTCGGFDFRFGIEVLAAPDMQVNIRSYRFVTATKGKKDAPSEIITLLISATTTSAFFQVVQAGKLNANQSAIKTKADVVTFEQPSVLPKETALDKVLLEEGAVVLTGLEFATGTSDLGKGPFPILKELAEFFGQRDDIRLLLVGHTDSVGGLDFNIALSKKRAASVRKRLLEAYGLDGARVEAEGNGYLAPLRSNLKAAGRTANRRVEAVILPLN
jgi:outer membrane protein OmpA-like peptidoglycan-associated protein